MKKREPKKLTLHRETLKSLASGRLKEAHGGLQTEVHETCAHISCELACPFMD